MTTGADLVAAAQKYAGTPYVMGAEGDADIGFAPVSALDCSELVQVALADLGIIWVDGHWVQWMQVRDAGLLIPITAAIDTPGALLFVYDGTTDGHVAISRGDGTTIEARGRAWGTGNWSAIHRDWTHGGLVPGLDYTEDVFMGFTPEQIKELVKEALAESLGEGFDNAPTIIDEGRIKMKLSDGNYWPLGDVLEFIHRQTKH